MGREGHGEGRARGRFKGMRDMGMEGHGDGGTWGWRDMGMEEHGDGGSVSARIIILGGNFPLFQIIWEAFSNFGREFGIANTKRKSKFGLFSHLNKL